MRWPDQPRTPTYDQRPVVPCDGEALHGAALWRTFDAQARGRSPRPVVVLDCYPGADVDTLVSEALSHLPSYTPVDVEDAALPVPEVDALLAPLLTEDRVFGRMNELRLGDFYDAGRLDALAGTVAAHTGPLLLHGWGAALAAPDDAVLVLVDMARWEIQGRQRRGAPTWRGDPALDALRKYKRGFFVEWRVADRHKVSLFDRLDWLVDGNAEAAVGTDGATFRRALAHLTTRPFRLVPYFDQGVWGGQWMKEMLGLDPTPANYAWCFDCVPEENSIVLRLTGGDIEVPALDLVLARPEELLGRGVHAAFGAEFPIRFDFLDTMGGGNLSLQVHPRVDYIRDTFGMGYTQDESYYILDAEPGAVVYLGLREDADPGAMRAALRSAQEGGPAFAADDFVARWPVERHDHVLIPAGTVHCSGAGTMTLEVSATPYIFTFKMWDWGRTGLDGLPRPVHLDHAFANVDCSRREGWVGRELLGRVEARSSGPGWRSEVTGLHELELIETTRHWFTGPVDHDTRGTVHVLNLVHGAEVVVESPTGAFAPFVVHHAETFVVPASVGPYRITPSGPGEHATLRAHVRGTEA